MVGGDRMKRILEAELGCRMGQNDAQDEVGLWLGQCNGTCERAPMIWVNGRVVGPLTMVETVKLARRIRAGEDVVKWPQRPIKIAPATFVGAEAVYGAEHVDERLDQAEVGG